LNAITAAAQALPAWRSRSGRERSRILRSWYDLVIANSDDLATLISWENGKAQADAMGEVMFAASFLEWFAEEAARTYGDTIPHSSSNFRVSVVKEPVGVCGLITPYAGTLLSHYVCSADEINQLEFSWCHGHSQTWPSTCGRLHRCC
jgi:succinate-semialdehyde dehydrogenase / glutarate-semialdehyde dehydrogenase